MATTTEAPSRRPGPSSPGRAGRLLLRIAPFAAVLGVTVVFFAPTIFQGRVFLAADTLSAFYPWRAFAPEGFQPRNPLITDPVNASWAANYNRLLKEGRIVDWNPYVGGGFPSCNSGTMGVPGRFYPLKLLFHAVFPTHVALSMLLMAHLFMMGWFMFLYLARAGAGRRGAVFGAVAYMLSGCAMVWLAFETVLPVGALLPLLLYFTDRFPQPGRFRWAFAAALVFGLMVLMGHVQYLLYVVLLLIFSCAFQLLRSLRTGGGWRVAVAIVSCFALTGALGAVRRGGGDLPGARGDLGQRPERPELCLPGDFQYSGAGPLALPRDPCLPGLLRQPAAGVPADPAPAPQEYMNYNELCLYLGVPTLFGLLAAVVRVRSSVGRFHLAATALLVADDDRDGLYWPVFRFSSRMDRLNPTRIIFLFVFTATAAAGFGIGSPGAAPARAPSGAPRGARGQHFAGAVAAAGFFEQQGQGRSSGSTAEWAARGDVRPALVEWVASMHARLALRDPAQAAAYHDCRRAAFYRVWPCFADRRARRGLGAIIVLLGYDLVSFGWGYNPAVAPKQHLPRDPGDRIPAATARRLPGGAGWRAAVCSSTACSPLGSRNSGGT